MVEKRNHWTVVDDDRLSQLEEELSPVLGTVIVSQPTQEETEGLIRSLIPVLEEEPSARETSDVWASTRRPYEPSIWRQMALQARVYGRSFWVVTFLSYVLLTLVMEVNLVGSWQEVMTTSVILIPAVLLASLFYSYRSWDAGMRSVESVTAFPPALVLLCRFLVVLLYELALVVMSGGYLLFRALTSDVVIVHTLQLTVNAIASLLLFFGVTAFVMLHRGVKAGFISAVLLWGVIVLTTTVLTWSFLWTVTGLALGLVLTFLAYRKGKTAFRFELS